jgi:hypothetical protein
MAGDFIKLTRNDDTATHVQDLLALVRSMRAAYDQASKVKETMSHMHDGQDFSALETNYGVPTGQGQAVFDLVNGALGSMTGTFQVDDAKELTERVG